MEGSYKPYSLERVLPPNKVVRIKVLLETKKLTGIGSYVSEKAPITLKQSQDRCYMFKTIVYKDLVTILQSGPVNPRPGQQWSKLEPSHCHTIQSPAYYWWNLIQRLSLDNWYSGKRKNCD